MIRRLIEQDAPQVSSVRSFVGKESPGPFGYRQQNCDLWQVRQEFARSGYAAFGAFSSEHLVGVASIAITPAVPNWFGLFGVAVLPEHRGKGLSRKLVTECISYASAAGAEGITLDVYTPNPVAKALYDSLGFEVWGDCPIAYRHDGVPYTEVAMRMFLNRSPAAA
jgi:ribosomal protein S18 acetylase RimI-like enzyme